MTTKELAESMRIWRTVATVERAASRAWHQLENMSLPELREVAEEIATAPPANDPTMY